jgi:hypothetical protein
MNWKDFVVLFMDYAWRQINVVGRESNNSDSGNSLKSRARLRHRRPNQRSALVTA